MAHFDVTFIDSFSSISRRQSKEEVPELWTTHHVTLVIDLKETNETVHIPKCQSFAKINVYGGPKPNSTKVGVNAVD